MKKVQIKLLVDVAGMAAGEIKNAKPEHAAVMIDRGQAEYVDSEASKVPAGESATPKAGAKKGVSKKAGK